jgi:hypothetical protein
MTPTAPTAARLCKTCATELIPHVGRGRPAAFCSTECERLDRAAAARARRAGVVAPSPVLAAVRAKDEAALARLDAELAESEALAEAVERLRPRFEADDPALFFEVGKLSVIERTALVALDDEREGTAGRQAWRYASYEHRREAMASFDDVAATYADDDADGNPVALSDPLGDSGFTGVGPGSHRGTSTWSSDFSLAAQARHTAREARALREACVSDAIRDARADARVLGIFELDDNALAAARATGNANADRLLAALV